MTKMTSKSPLKEVSIKNLNPRKKINKSKKNNHL